MRTIAFAIVAAFALAPSLAHAKITSVTWDPTRSQSPTFGGLAFGAVGQYEKLRGTAVGELDPLDAHNLQRYIGEAAASNALKCSPGRHRMVPGSTPPPRVRRCRGRGRTWGARPVR